MLKTRTLNRIKDLSAISIRFASGGNSAGNDSWLSKLLVRRIEPSKESHSRMLSDKEVVYALHTHNIRPDSTTQYLQN